MTTPVKDLLKQISDKLEKVKDIDYNIFSILKVKTSELKHSLFLQKLLSFRDTKGNHIFLESFLDEVLKNRNFLMADLTEKQVSIETEFVLKNWENGIAIKDNPALGRADIWIKDEQNNYIIIENKIFAGDQYRQLARYDKYLQGERKNKEPRKGNLLYLTIDGRPATKYSTGHDKINYHRISYIEISSWLESLKNIHSPLKEYIKQYKDILKSLIKQYEITELIKPVYYALKDTIDRKPTDEKIEKAIEYIKEKNILENLSCWFELKFWENLELYLSDKINEGDLKWEITDRKKFSYEKIEKSKRKDNKVAYGLVIKINVNEDKYFRIYTNKDLKSLRYGFGKFVNKDGKLDEWGWDTSNPLTYKKNHFEEIIRKGERESKEFADEIMRKILERK
ncbi:MAG: PD-(D/E)XK nuclease family protein [Candidatus Symbiothrix sp.]|jgi:hypothetical protein|nr:PD-(D/E)XK nuclease family protein [Candidatus Symbiothrix sp.]